MTEIEKFRDWFSGADIAHLATVDAHGAPTAVPVWLGIEGDRLVVQTMPGSLKAKSFARDPRVAFSLTKTDNAFQAVTVRGRVVERRDDVGIWPIIDRISNAYIGQDYPARESRAVYFIEVDRATVHEF